MLTSATSQLVYLDIRSDARDMRWRQREWNANIRNDAGVDKVGSATSNDMRFPGYGSSSPNEKAKDGTSAEVRPRAMRTRLCIVLYI